LGTLTARGIIKSIELELLNIAALVRFRKEYGWSPFHDDEVWEYYTEQDDRVCPDCEGFGSQFEIIGSDILNLFPEQQSLNLADSLHRHRWPDVHDASNLYPDRRGKCRCNMFWREPVRTLAERLHDEITQITSFEAVRQ